MPLPNDSHVVEVSKNLVETFHGIFGPHPGFRPAHAKGILLKGTFTPTDTARSLSVAQHLNAPSTPVLVRFSSSTGIPTLPDTDPNGNPRGVAIRFQLAESPRRVHTDIIAHSVDGFPGSNGDEALAFFRALAGGEIAGFLASHPKAAAFVQLPKPFPASFATETYFGVNAIKLVDAEGRGTFVRYRVVPAAGVHVLSDEEAKEKGANYLYDEVSSRVGGSGGVVLRLTAQVAEEGDVTDDACVHWPEERKVVELGTITLDGLVEDGLTEQQRIIFDPVPRVPGLEPSADPLLDVRAGVYLISGSERRAAPPTSAA